MLEIALLLAGSLLALFAVTSSLRPLPDSDPFGM